MIRVCICDDDVTITNKISTILDNISKTYNITMKVDMFYDGTTLMQNIQKTNSYYDIMFLDIEMKDMDGLETAKRMRDRDELAYIIFVTSYENYAIETFSVRPYQFVLKPFDDNVIEGHFMDIYNRLLSNDECFEFKFNNTYYKILLKDIMYFESEKRCIVIHMADGKKYVYYDRLDKIQNRINDSKLDFWRIHQSLLVNTRFIKIKKFSEIVLVDETVLQISEKKRVVINQQYMKNVEEIMRYGRDS